MDKCCGTCGYHTQTEVGEWVCACEESEAYTDFTFYDQVCGDYVSREELDNEAG